MISQAGSSVILLESSIRQRFEILLNLLLQFRLVDEHVHLTVQTIEDRDDVV